MKNFMLFDLVGCVFLLIELLIMYFYLKKKVKANLKLILFDIILVYILSCFVFLGLTFFYKFQILSFVVGALAIPILGFFACMFRFYRSPHRQVSDDPETICSPCDGNVIYIKKLENNQTPISIKNGRVSKLDEIIKTDLVSEPCWLIGINMTPFDVHKNCSPIDGKILLNEHFNGKFMSLKEAESDFQNERNTFVIENNNLKVGVVLIASKLVRRIVSYVNIGDVVKKGEWIGIIKFGSQVDVILPLDSIIKVKLGQQVYAKSTIIAANKTKFK